MPVFTFSDSDNKMEASAGMRTLALQEMIKRGILFQGLFSPCFSHTQKDVDFFADTYNDMLQVYKKALADGYEKYLIGLPAKPVFRKFL